MVDFEYACQGIDKLVEDYRLVGDRPALRESITNKMFDYVNSLGGEAGLHKMKLIQDYLRRTKQITNQEIYQKENKK